MRMNALKKNNKQRMGRRTCLFGVMVCFMVSPIVHADYVPNGSYTKGEYKNEFDSAGGSGLEQSLNNLGSYLGYSLTTPPTTAPYDQLLYPSNYSNLNTNNEYLSLIGFFKAFPVNSIVMDMLALFVPSENTYATSLNALANTTFLTYATPSQSTASVIANVDQAPYLNDPVSQYLFNILGTPDWSVCNALATSSSTYQISTQGCLSQLTTMETELGFLTTSGENNTLVPGASEFWSESYVKPILGVLNPNTLIAPLVYDNQSSNSSTGSSAASNTLTNANQAESAALLVRTLLGPIQGLANNSSYQSMFNAAFPSGTADLTANQSSGTVASQQALITYLLGLRTTAARMAVPASNLYDIYSKRVVTPGSNGASPTSQALSEFQMATWRLYQPSQTTQWVDQINSASPATVQKEMAILLSELNYQMYLQRQMQERLVLTNSIMLIQALSSQSSLKSIPQANG